MDDLILLKPGLRVLVSTKNRGMPIGLGTFVQHDEILLDKGQKISLTECEIDSLLGRSEAQPFEVRLIEPLRIFARDGYGLHNREHDYLDQGKLIRIEKLEVCRWYAQDHLAGKFRWDYDERWVLIWELELPRVQHPHLQLVA